MKHYYFFLSIAMMASLVCVDAQTVTVAEPEFVNSYFILTSDSTYEQLPKESGTIGKHENKVRKWSKVVGKVANVAGAVGAVGFHAAGASGSLSGMVAGVRTVSTAASVGSAADAVSGLAGSAGMDIIFKGGHSSYSVNADGNDIRLLIKGESNETDPMDCYRIVRFSTSKKERRIQWMEFEPALIGTEETAKAGYIGFTGHKYGEQSYLLTIPASELEEGEYGIFFMNIITAMAIPVGTFQVMK